MKRLLSWLVLPICYVLVYAWFLLVVRGAFWAYDLLTRLSTLGVILVVLFLGSLAIALLFAPLKYGALLTVSASDAISPSLRGERYRTFSVILFMLTAASFYYSFKTQNTINIGAIFVAIYCIELFVFSKINVTQDD